jgi:hypothetical protein
MLTDEDLQKIAMLLATTLEAYGLKRPKVLKAEQAAIRMRAYRKRHASNVTASVTERNGERNAPQREKRNGQRNGSEHERNAVPVTRATWEAYSAAYQDRYHAAPKWNKSVGGMVKNFVNKLGAEEAPHVAAFYLTHNSHFYVREMHCVRIMLRDAEKLRTEWATRRTVTDAEARQADRTQTNMNVWGKLIAEAEANEGKQDTH